MPSLRFPRPPSTHYFYSSDSSGVVFLGDELLRVSPPKVDVREKTEVELRVRPRTSDGVLLFWGAEHEAKAKGDFVALFLVASQPHFFWNLGSGIAYAKWVSSWQQTPLPHRAEPLSNHRWSRVLLSRHLREGFVQVDDGHKHSQISLVSPQQRIRRRSRRRTRTLTSSTDLSSWAASRLRPSSLRSCALWHPPTGAPSQI